MSRKLVAVIVSAAAALFSPLGVFLSSGPIKAAAAGPIANLSFSPAPIAPPGTLGANQSVTVTVTATDSGNAAIDAAAVYLSFSAASGGGTATAPDPVTGTPDQLTAQPHTFYTNNAGQVNITYKTGATPPHTGEDMIIAEDDPNSPTVSASDSYIYNSITGISISPKTMVTGNETVTVLPARTQKVYLNFVHNGAPPAGTAMVGSTALTSTFQQFTTDGSGTLTVSYTTAAVATGGEDILTAQDFATNPVYSDSASHTYSGGPPVVVTNLAANPSPIAKAGSLGNSGTATFSITASSPLGPTGGGTFTVCFTHISGTGSGSATVTDAAVTNHSVPLCSTTPFGVTANGNGQVSVTYTAGGTGTSGLDSIVASASGPPASSATNYYNYDPVASYSITTSGFGSDSANPQKEIAAATSLNDDTAGCSRTSSTCAQTRTVSITALDKGGQAVPHATVYVSFTATNGGGAATWNSGNNTLTATPTAFETADGTGKVTDITYTAPSKPPTGGQDVILMTSDSTPTNGTVIQRAVYDFALTDLYRFSPTPIASTGTISAGGAPIVLRLTAYDNRPGTPSPPRPQAGATVYLTFSGASSGAGASSASVSGTKLTGTPQPFTTDINGNVTITYVPPASLPSGGADVLNAVDATKNPAAVAADSYRFPAPGDYVFSPAPIAATGSLSPGATVGVSLGGPPFPSPLYLSLTSTAFSGGAAGSAIATCSTSRTATVQLALTSAPQKCIPDANGQIPITYTAASPLPAGGSDAITAQNQAGGATVVVTDSYTYANLQGYWLVASDGGIFPFGPAAFGFGSTGNIHLNQPIVGMASAPGASGYWLVASDGGIFPFGRAGGYGSTGNIHLNQPIVGMASTPDGGGYWLVASDGGIFPFGDAGGYGSTGNIHLNKPIVGMAATGDGKGYWLVASDGGIFPFGDAGGFGSTGNIHLNKPIVGMAATGDGKGYWLVASDGGIFPFGDAAGLGSTGNIPLNKPMVGMATTASGGGYWLVASDGGIFPFGDAAGLGSTGGIHLNQPIVGMAAAR